MRVTVACSPGPRQVQEWHIELPEGAVLADALAQCGLDGQGLHLAVWGRAATTGQALRDGDRVELLRPLQVDPKVARRQRFQRQGARGTGLFARKKGGRGGGPRDEPGEGA